MSTPPLLTGLWLTDVDGWRVDIDGAGSWTHELPDHPFADINLELDGIGCLASATLSLTRPLGLHPFSGTAKLWAHDRYKGWVPLAQGLIRQPLDKVAAPSEITLDPLETLVMGDYYSGAIPPDIPGVTVSRHNEAGVVAKPQESAWTVTNDSVIGDALRGDSLATIGVDAYRRIMIARPNNGNPVRLNSADLYDLQPSAYEYPPYATVSRCDPGVGWKKVEWRVERPAYVPRVAVQPGSVEFKEEVRGFGPELVNCKTVTISEGTALTQDFSWRGEETSLEVTAQAFACVMVWDLQTWYSQSALYAQDQESLKAAKEELAAARMVLGQRVAWYGDHHQYVQEARQELKSAENAMSAALASAVGGESDYEPLSALLTLGLQPLEWINTGEDTDAKKETTINLDWAIWLSKKAWDDQAVGEAEETDDGYSPLHPKDQLGTIKVLLSSSDVYDPKDMGRPIQPADLTIPDALFRQNQGPRIAAELLANWKKSFEPDDPPEDAEPPAWDGRWYLHVGCAFSGHNPDRVVYGGGGHGTTVSSPSPITKAKLWLYRPQFGVKVVIYPPPPEALTYPTYLGPNKTALVRGIVLPPATAAGETVAGVRINLTAPDTSTGLNIGVTPYGKG